ncbi:MULTISPECIES: DUF1816 domain-containing protein [Aerosakkonema]|uniref:DUF1816 domain-containing protein n=1 Tax=Aerosakkonema TaxID=1246629 RepID=UPI0035B9DC6B
MKEILISILNLFGLAWWIEIQTQSPRCTYYFGPFLSAKDAEAEIGGYQEDLKAEGAQVSAVLVKRCKPAKLTVEYETSERSNRKGSSAYRDRSSVASFKA